MRGLVFAIVAFTMVCAEVSAEPARYNHTGYFEVSQKISRTINADSILKQIIKDHNDRYRDVKAEEIKQLDEKWKNGDDATISPILNNKLAAHITEEIKKSGGLIAEIIVMGAKGLNVAAYPKTSDFFQGDEAKWLETFAKGPAGKHIGKVAFDDSTQKHLQQISQSIVIDGKHVGAITIGFDITAH